MGKNAPLLLLLIQNTHCTKLKSLPPKNDHMPILYTRGLLVLIRATF